MRKIKMLSLLALVLLVMVTLKCCGGKEKKNDVQQPDAAQSGEEAPSQASKALDTPLGVIEKNEDGGIVITLEKEDGATEKFVFTDVEADSWYAEAVNYVVSTGLMNGSEDGPIFLPN